LVVLDQAIDTTTSSGRLTFHVIGAIAEFERDLIRERTRDGLAAALARRGGRLPVQGASISPDKLAVAQDLYLRGMRAKHAAHGWYFPRVAVSVPASGWPTANVDIQNG
jgi:DNA invertase Pin-like site-specific DNA recombinase